MKMKASEQLQLGAWVRWVVILLIMPRLLLNKIFLDFYLNYIVTPEAHKTLKRRPKKHSRVSSRCVPT
jgi:hypothetical protein